jgi:hypothetical protein
MSSVNQIVGKTQKFTIDNSPVILAAVGAAGVLGVAFLTGRASFKAADVIAAEETRRMNSVDPVDHVPFGTMDKIKLVWPLYLPPAGLVVLTCGAVISSNRISTSRSAALASAFAVSEQAFSAYKEKVVEKIGETKANQVKDAVAKDRILVDPPTDDNIIIVTNGEGQLFQDSWSARYFKSDMEDVRRAVNELNHQVNIHGHATLSDFYDLLGLAHIKQSDEIGWNADALLDVYFAPVMHDDGKRPVMAMEYRVVPTRDYFLTH